jgi:hydrogenase nickel incorporation protein HypA/HybF
MAIAAAHRNGAHRITALKLRIGVLSGVVPEALQFAWDVVTRQTIAEGAQLEIESVPASAWCPVCQAGFACADFYTECPRCHQVIGELRHGRELELVAVETI